MKLLLRSLLLCLLCCGALAVQAAPALPAPLVEAVQVPAWLERDGHRQPLVPGQSLGNRDRVLTGSGARVLIRLPEGSAVKLGENAQFHLNALGQRSGGVYTAALDVLKGAFRFTTGLFPSRLQHRAVNIRVATLTAGVRGTDLWGKSNEEKDLLCLIEGNILVTHPQGEPLILDQPLSFAVAPHGEAPQPVGTVDWEQIGRWMVETEVAPGRGVLQRGGRWGVLLAPVAGQAEALALYDRLREAGYPARIQPRREKVGESGEEGYVYGLRVGGFAGEGEARAAAARLAEELAVSVRGVSR